MLSEFSFHNVLKLLKFYRILIFESNSQVHHIQPEMEIPALLYFSCWSLISISFLGFGFKALDKQKSQISPLIIFLLKRFLAICVCHSSTYALVHRPDANNTSLINHLKISILGFSFPLYVYIMSGPVPLSLVLSYAFLVTAILLIFMRAQDFGLSVDFLVRSIIFSLRVQNDRFFAVFVLVTAFFTAGIAAIFDGLFSDQKGSNGTEPETRLVEKYSKKRKIVEFGAPIVASIVFQVLVRFTSLSHVVAFLCFAVAWLGCLALTMARFDLGVFDLLVCNVLLGCVNQFSLYGPTWFAYAASVVLFVLHSKVKTVRFVHDLDTILW